MWVKYMLFFLCMDYVGGVNMSLRTANKLPQAYPLLVLEQEAKILVVDQELLQYFHFYPVHTFKQEFSFEFWTDMSWGLLLIPWVLKHLQDGFDQIECYIPSSLLHLCSGVFDFQNLAHLFVKLNNGSKEKVNHTIEFLKTFSFPSFSFCLLETHGYVANSTVGHLPIFFYFYFFEVLDTCPFLFPRDLSFWGFGHMSLFISSDAFFSFS